MSEIKRWSIQAVSLYSISRKTGITTLDVFKITFRKKQYQVSLQSNDPLPGVIIGTLCADGHCDMLGTGTVVSRSRRLEINLHETVCRQMQIN